LKTEKERNWKKWKKSRIFWNFFEIFENFKFVTQKHLIFGFILFVSEKETTL
jgi:hypothetical protein